MKTELLLRRGGGGGEASYSRYYGGIVWCSLPSIEIVWAWVYNVGKVER